MKIIICGAGQVGFGIARYLAQGNNDVVVIDIQAHLIKKVTDLLDVQGVAGFATQPNILKQAGAHEADLIIAVTRHDEVNMIICQVAHSIFNIEKKIARIRNQNYLDASYKNFFSPQHVPIDEIITPEIEVAKTLKQFIQTPGVFDLIPLKEKSVQLVGIICKENCPLLNTPLKQIGELFPDLNIFIVAIFRNNTAIIPQGIDQILPHDEVYFTVQTTKFDRALMIFGYEKIFPKHIIIAGGGIVGETIGKLLKLDHHKPHFTIVEKDPKIAHHVAVEMPNNIVIQGDILENDIFKEMSVQGNETFLAVTNNSETNILSSIIAKRQGVERAITLITSKNFEPLVAPLGIDAIINPHIITISSILRHIRKGRIEAVHTLKENFAEIIETWVYDDSPLINIELKELKLAYGMKVIAIIREEKVIIPFGKATIRAHDYIIFFATQAVIKKAEKLFIQSSHLY